MNSTNQAENTGKPLLPPLIFFISQVLTNEVEA